MVRQHIPLSAPSAGAASFPYADHIQTVPRSAYRKWLARGWDDFTAMPAIAMAYGALFSVGGLLLTVGLNNLGMLYLITPLTAGFLLLAPALAVGIYDLSRRRQAREPVSLWGALMAWRRNSFHLLTAGLVLMLFLMIWVRLAALIFAVTFPYTSMTTHALWSALWTWEGAAFLGFGVAVGGVMATLAFVFGAISLPLMVDRRCDVFTAALISAQAVVRNWQAMIPWAATLALLGGLGLVTGFLGLTVMLPLLGHATWHAYKSLISWPENTNRE